MKTCEHSEKLAAYHDGELPEPERRAMERHLLECASCRRELAKLRELSRILCVVPVPEMSAGLPARLEAGLRRAGEREVIRICRVASMVQAPPTWEVAAVTLDSELAQADWGETFARWVVEDLSRENGS
jgi:anti-sigma factor RsiW